MKRMYKTTRPDGALSSRPTGMLVYEASRFDASIRLCTARGSADLKHLSSVMQMRPAPGEPFTVEISGPDERRAAEAIAPFFSAT